MAIVQHSRTYSLFGQLFLKVFPQAFQERPLIRMQQLSCFLQRHKPGLVDFPRRRSRESRSHSRRGRLDSRCPRDRRLRQAPCWST